ncbi:PTS system mannose/fructose/sorbose family transporter subunit IID [candidate division KSB1 bacterium]|nr:PTS system mannose/fructose/sorbose family transporter subunit IID [candidate division KSB1 bacterium]
MVKPITRKDLFEILLRTFFVQGSWNFKSLIGLGFCYCAIPIAKRLFPDPEDQKDFLKRHLNFFNAHPYFTSWCLGAVAKIEFEAEKNQWADLEAIQIFKTRLAGPLGSIGDQLFWSGVKPLVSGIAFCCALVLGWMAIPFLLVLYNVPHFYTRYKGLILGYKKGFEIVADLSLRRFQKYLNAIKAIGLFVAGFSLAIAAKVNYDKGADFLAAFIAAVIVSYITTQKRRSIIFTLFLTMIIGIAVGFVHLI